MIEAVLFFGEFDAAPTGAHDDTDSPQLFPRHGSGLQTGVTQRLPSRRDRQRSRPRNVGAVFGRNVLLFIKVFDLPGHLDGQTGGVEASNGTNPGLAQAGRPPEGLPSVSVGAEGAYSGDDHA